MVLRRQQHLCVPLTWRVLSGFRSLETGVNAGQHPVMRSVAGWPKKRLLNTAVALAALRAFATTKSHLDDPSQRMGLTPRGEAARYANAGGSSTVGARFMMLTMVRILYARHHPPTPCST
jgi:hypothetical protein